MLEARLAEAGLLKKLLDAVKELVTDANFDCNEEGISLQAMDNSHVALVAVHLRTTAFSKYRCDRPMPLGVNLASLTKVIKCAQDTDSCTLKAADEGDVLGLTYESKNSDRIAEYEMKLMDIDSENLGIPDTDYEASVSLPSSEFSRIVRDLAVLGESVRIEVSKEGVRFASEGEAANGNVLLKMTDGEVEVDTDKEDGAKEEEDAEEEEEEEDGPKVKKGKKEKKAKVKKEADAEDVDMDDGEKEDSTKEESENGDDDGEDEVDADEEDGDNKKKRKRGSGKAKSKPAKKAKKKKDEDGGSGGVRITMNSHVSLTFSLKYLINFSKSGTLADRVILSMSNDVPLRVNYRLGSGHIHYYLAPKIGDD